MPARYDEKARGMVAFDPWSNPYVAEDAIDLRAIWQIIRKHQNTILAFFGIVFVTVLIATLLMRPVYRATATVEVRPESGGMIKFQNVEATSIQTSEFLQTQSSIIKSRKVAWAVISDLKLQNNPEINGELAQRGIISSFRRLLRNFNSREEISNSEKNAQMVERFLDRVSVSLLKRSYLFKVSFDSFDPELSAQVANSIVKNYMRLNEERRLHSTAGAENYLQREIKRVKEKLEASERDLTAYARDNSIVDVEEKDNTLTVRLTETNTQLAQVSGERIAAQTLYRQSTQPDGMEAMAAVLGNELIQKYKTKQNALQAEYLKLSKIYKPAYPKLQQLDAQLKEVKVAIDDEKSRIKQGMKLKYEQLLNKESLLQEQVESIKRAILDVRERSVQYNILKREWETNKQLYTGLLERMKEVGVAAGMEINNIALVDQAIRPREMFKPDMKLNLLLASILGLIGGVGLAFLLEFLDNTVRTQEELEKITGLASLGSIPKLGSASDERHLVKSGVERLDAPSSRQSALISYHDRDGNMAEAFRTLRTSLMFSTPDGLPRVLQLVSTGPGEGKTMVATNLAAVLADTGLRILLVDADLRNPGLHKVFRCPSSPGLTEALARGAGALKTRNTEIENLDVLTSGSVSSNPAEMLVSAAMDQVLDELRTRYDHVILDSAPIMGLADAVILATKVNGVVYTVRAGEVNRDALIEGIKRLRGVNAPLLGCVLNEVELERSYYGYPGSHRKVTRVESVSALQSDQPEALAG